ncbi:MAG: NADP-dependent isocitrate dehydrogenase [Verrucomicrobia bacterium]|nr:MAG: NADP-dependent isocitrate dehydrogenase [Verrucomicrobiota bacterium]
MKCTQTATNPNVGDADARTGKHCVTLIPGDGIGPEVTEAVRRVLSAANAPIEWEIAEAGRNVFEAGVASGVPRETIDSINRTRAVLKGPLETPVGHGGKSANVTLRKMFEAFGNIRPVRQLPQIRTPYSGRKIDFVVIRENVEDLYAGIEHGQTPDVAQCLKLISTKGCDKISRLAFNLARSEGRRSVHVATKANIMKKTEGMMKRVFEQVARDYPDIKPKHVLIDNCAHQLVVHPEQFEVIVTTNMNGDIISDLASGLVGGLGLAPSANIGHEVAIFEPVHGSAPDIAGMDRANPTAMLLSAVLMLRFLGEGAVADEVEAALLVTLSDGCGFTLDVADGRPVLGTRAFADTIIRNLGRRPEGWVPRAHASLAIPAQAERVVFAPAAKQEVVGIDLFTAFDGSAATLGRKLEQLAGGSGFRLKMISNRGTQVYPDRGNRTDCVDHWRCRFVLDQAAPTVPFEKISLLVNRFEAAGIGWMHIEKLNRYDGEDAFTKAQGED